VNHCVNDIAVLGAEPLFFLDYLGTGVLEPHVFTEIIRGFARGCAANSCTVSAIASLGQSLWTPLLAASLRSCSAMPRPCTTSRPWLWTDCCSTGPTSAFGYAPLGACYRMWCTSSSVTGAEEAF
jgi:hypothetical protein